MNGDEVIFSLGSNLGDRELNLRTAFDALGNIGDIRAISDYFYSPAFGFEGPDFVNIILVMHTELNPEDLFMETFKIEKSFGKEKRQTGQPYASRLLDIDIIDYKGELINTEKLVIPHPKMQERDFVLEPLKEVRPNWRHPSNGKTVEDLIKNLQQCT